MMCAHLLGVAPSFPPMHSRAYHGDVVDGTALHGSVSADRIEAFAAKYLAGSRHVLDADETVIVDRSGKLLKWRPDYSQRRICAKLYQKKLEVVCVECNICIEARDDFVVNILQPLATC